MNIVDRNPPLRPRSLRPFPAEPVDAAAFFRWCEGQEGRFELVAGKIIIMPRASRNHARVMVRIATALTAALGPGAYDVSAAHLGVQTGAGIRYPDVLVDPADRDGAERSSDAPLFIAEILSTWSVGIDMIEKAAEYTGLDSLKGYAVFSQDEPRAWIWRRGPEGWPLRPEMVEGRDAVLPLPGLDAALSFVQIYRGIGPAS